MKDSEAMRSARFAALACALVIVVSAVSACSSRDVAIIGIPNRASQSPQLSAHGSVVVAAWVALDPNSSGGADAFIAMSHNGGSGFGAPVRVNDVAGEVRASEQQVPRVAMHENTIAVVWTSRRGNATEIRLAVSTDHGASFGASRRISPEGAPGTRGWASLTIDDDDRVRIAWLDTRVAAAEKLRAVETPHAAGHTMSGGTQQDLYVALVEPDGTQAERLASTNVCFCCKTAIAQTSAHTFIAFRDIYGDNMRDISVVHVGNAEITRSRVSEDGWQIAGCPEDGPALVASTRGLDIVWPTAVSADALQRGVFTSSASLTGPFSPRTRLDSGHGTAIHPALATNRFGDLAATWEVIGEGSHRIERRIRRGQQWGPIEVVATGESVSSPAIVGAGGRFVTAWTERFNGVTTVRVRY